MFQTKERDISPEKDFKEMKISNPPDKQFKVMVIKMRTKLGRRMDEQEPLWRDRKDKKVPNRRYN